MPLLETIGSGSARGIGRGLAGKGLGLFEFGVGSSYTFRPNKFGSYGMSQSDWQGIYSSLSAPWNGVSSAQTFPTHPNESSRNNPVPGVIPGITGFPEGTYRITIAGGGGADADPGFGAPGGLGQCELNILSSDTVYFTVGQGGIYTGSADRSTNQPWYFPNPGGWNGGGAAGAQNSSSMYSGSGGGGSDIRLNGTSLSDRIIVSGGGGGATDQNQNTGGRGGGPNQNGEVGGYNSSNENTAGRGGTLTSGGEGARYNGTLYESYMNGGLWFGGRGYDGSQPVGSANAAGGGGGGYYGGGGAVDEASGTGGGAGGGSGYADLSKVTVISATLGGANNGNPNYTWRAGSVNGNGTTSFTDWNGSTFDPTSTNSDNSRYNTYRSDGRTINRRYGNNGYISIQRIS